MSGGSYDYLFCTDAFEIHNKIDELNKMRDRLTELGYLDAAKETESVILMLNSFEVRINARIERLNAIWKAVEWFDSSDWGIDDIENEINKYRES